MTRPRLAQPARLARRGAGQALVVAFLAGAFLAAVALVAVAVFVAAALGFGAAFTALALVAACLRS